jgi:acetyltransferase-like isoleucine patch superfamily enzyme
LQKKWVKPKYNKMGMTQWGWRVVGLDNFTLGNNVEIGSFTVIDAKEGVTIEDNVKIGWSCSILSYSTIDDKKGKVILKRGCKIGANSVILPGITIGENATVGANSFVNKNIPSNETWVGSPARKLKR